MRAASSGLSCWARYDLGAKKRRVGLPGGPAWSSVARRVSIDLSTGELLDDERFGPGDSLAEDDREKSWSDGREHDVMTILYFAPDGPRVPPVANARQMALAAPQLYAPVGAPISFDGRTSVDEIVAAASLLGGDSLRPRMPVSRSGSASESHRVKVPPVTPV